jgi:hypothetical protein
MSILIKKAEECELLITEWCSGDIGITIMPLDMDKEESGWTVDISEQDLDNLYREAKAAFARSK